MKLYTYFRSSSAYRVRIGLNLKGIAYTSQAINLLKAEQKGAQYLANNPQGLVPALELDDGTIISQSTAILEWLEETHPETPLLPRDALTRAAVRSLINHIACEIQPLNNMGVTTYLKDKLDAEPEQISQWYSHWMSRGFGAVELVAKQGNGQFFQGDQPGMAECYLIPQVFNALRFDVDMSECPAIMSIYNHCNTLEPFQRAHPQQQADAPQ